MSIIDNAKNSIIMGLEDYTSDNPDRLISCARNIFAGILLLFKHKLNLLSPPNSNEALIKQKVLPMLDASGKVIWVGKGKNTVDVQQIRERFNSLNISVEWDRVEAINKFRNDIEHYHSQLSKDAIRDLISNSFLIIRDFLSLHLGRDPKAYLGNYAWNILISVADVYNKENEDCVSAFDNVEWGSGETYSSLVSFKCKQCGSGLITIRDPKDDRHENEFYCKSCDETWDFESFTTEAIEDYFSFENYIAMTDGSEPGTIMCPECSQNTYIVEEQYCPLCEASVEHECQRCGMHIPPEEIDGSGYCSYCTHVSIKDD